jgi:hypothetical protein
MVSASVGYCERQIEELQKMRMGHAGIQREQVPHGDFEPDEKSPHAILRSIVHIQYVEQRSGRVRMTT